MSTTLTSRDRTTSRGRVLVAEDEALIRLDIRTASRTTGGTSAARPATGARPCAWLTASSRMWHCSTSRCPASTVWRRPGGSREHATRRS